MFLFSGGVPKLLCTVAYFAWEQRQRGETVDWKRVREDSENALSELFARWAKHFDQAEVDLLKNRARTNCHLEPLAASECLRLLIRRGLIQDSQSESDVNLRDMYPISSVMFRNYCNTHALEAYSNTALPAPAPGPSNLTVHVHSGGKLYMDGSVDQSNTISFNGESIQELVHWIAKPEQAQLPTERFQQLLGSTLSEHFRACLPESIPERASDISDEDYELICDEHYSKVSEKLLPSIPVNEDNEAIIEVDAEELLTVDDRFEAVRHRRTDLTNEVLNGQSERCQLYLKLSVIVEDALSIVGAFMDDYSPQLVLYGKALEQSLPQALRSDEGSALTVKDFLQKMDYLMVYGAGSATKELIEMLPTYQYERIQNTTTVNTYSGRSVFHPFHRHRGHGTAFGQIRTIDDKKSLFEMQELQRISAAGTLLLYCARKNLVFLADVC